MFKFDNLLKAVLVLRGIAASGVAHAQETWPARPITLVVPVAAGSGTDIGARLVAKHMAGTLNVPVVVENKVGANGMIAAQFVARARPDGYVLLVGNATSNAANYAFYQGQNKLGYTPASFEIAGAMGLFPMSLYVAANAPWRTLGDLVADAKRQPGKFNCGSGNSTTQVACEVLRKQAAIDIVTVPYKGNPQSLMDVAGGQLSFAFADAAVAQAFVDGRKLRALAVAATQRNPSTPEAATFIEQGYAGFEITTWLAMFAPAGTPPAILERLNGAIRQSNQTPEAVQSRVRSGGVVVTQTLPEARRWIDAEVARWGHFIQVTGVKPE
ncbi:tripartite tricarboxylate transporter substrate binding protein [Polaromonas sp. P1(28)-13]|nr:tripartite tricarboxylate transporter substrate binding protein [Polaromonas sp. P1(28)-13]